MAEREDVHIIGGGITGLAAAYELAKAGRRPIVHEATDRLGGLSSSIPIGNGWIDRYYHFICPGDDDLVELAEELGLAEEINFVPAASAHWYERRTYPLSSPLDLLRFYPLGFTDRIQLGRLALKCRRIGDWHELDGITAEQWLQEAAGENVYRVVWRPMLEGKFGAAASRVSAAWIWHRIHRASRGRKHPFAREVYGYIRNGTQTVINALAAEIERRGGQVRLNSPVEGIVFGEGGEVAGLRAGGRSIPAECVLSTVPLPALLELLPDTTNAEYREQLARIEFIGVLCVLLASEKPITGRFWTNIADPGTPFNGVIEYTALDDQTDLGAHMAYVPRYVDPSDPFFSQSDEEIMAACCATVQRLNPDFDEAQVSFSLVERDRYAQAICVPGFSEWIPKIVSPHAGLYVTDSTQLYPEDRNRSGMIALAREAAGRIGNSGMGE